MKKTASLIAFLLSVFIGNARVTDAKDIFMSKVILNAAKPLFKLKSGSNILLNGKLVDE